MKSKEIEIEIDSLTADKMRIDKRQSFVWVRPNSKFKSAMELRGGFTVTPTFSYAFSLVKFSSLKENSCVEINSNDMNNAAYNGVFNYCYTGNVSFFRVNPCSFDGDYFDITGIKAIFLRKYTPEQKKWLTPILKLFKNKRMVIGEFYPARPVDPTVDHIYLSDTYCYFKLDGIVKELDPRIKITFKTFKAAKGVKLTKKDILKALDHIADTISEREVVDKQFQHKDAQGKWRAQKNRIKDYATGYKSARCKEIAFAKAEQAAKSILTPEELKYLIEIHKVSAQDTRSYKVEVEKHMFEYKRYLTIAKSPVPTKEDYKLPDKQMDREFTKIKKFLDQRVIDKFDYDPSKGIVITFPPMEYKSYRGGIRNRVFLGRPRVVIHDPSVCPLGPGSCSIIRFTLPSYPTGLGCTDHFDNSNGPDYLHCKGSASLSRNGQCLGTSTSDSFLNIFMPLISSRRFGELIPHLKRYILESNGSSPLLTPPENMVFSGIKPEDRHPTNIQDDSWTEFVRMKMREEAKTLEETV